MANPEQDAFRNRDKVDEAQKQTEETSRHLLEDARPGDRVTPVARVSDTANQSHESALMSSLSRASELAGRLHTEMLTEFIDNSKGVFERTILAGIDPRNKEQGQEIMNVLARAIKTA